jgi:hypothetical protein
MSANIDGCLVDDLVGAGEHGWRHGEAEQEAWYLFK